MKTIGYFMAVLCIFSLVGTGAAAQIEVGDGQEYRTIADAVNAADSGDIILVKEGIYSIDDSVFLKENIVICGAGDNKTVIYTDSKTDISSASNPAMLVCKGVSNVEICNLTFKGPATSLSDQHNNGGTSKIGGLKEARNGIKLDNAKNIQVHDCYFTALYGDGIRISNTEGVNIYNCRFDCAGHDSISVFKSQNVKMSNCKFNMMINTCVRFYNAEKCALTNSTFTQSILGTGAGYIELEGTVNNVAVSHNVFLNSSDPVIFTANPRGGKVVVNDNILYGVSGLKASYTPYDVTLVDNDVYKTEQNWTEMGYGYNGGAFQVTTPYINDGIDVPENVTEETVTVEEVVEDVESELVEVFTELENCTENCTVTNETIVVEGNVSSVVIQFFDDLTAKYFDFSSEQTETALILAYESANDLQQAKTLMNNTTEEEKELGKKYLEASKLKLQYAQDLLNLSREGLDEAKNRMNSSCEGGEC
jgi:hypothetical protein